MASSHIKLMITIVLVGVFGVMKIGGVTANFNFFWWMFTLSFHLAMPPFLITLTFNMF